MSVTMAGDQNVAAGGDIVCGFVGAALCDFRSNQTRKRVIRIRSKMAALRGSGGAVSRHFQFEHQPGVVRVLQ